MSLSNMKITELKSDRNTEDRGYAGYIDINRLSQHLRTFYSDPIKLLRVLLLTESCIVGKAAARMFHDDVTMEHDEPWEILCSSPVNSLNYTVLCNWLKHIGATPREEAAEGRHVPKLEETGYLLAVKELKIWSEFMDMEICIDVISVGCTPVERAVLDYNNTVDQCFISGYCVASLYNACWQKDLYAVPLKKAIDRRGKNSDSSGTWPSPRLGDRYFTVTVENECLRSKSTKLTYRTLGDNLSVVYEIYCGGMGNNDAVMDDGLAQLGEFYLHRIMSMGWIMNGSNIIDPAYKSKDHDYEKVYDLNGTAPIISRNRWRLRLLIEMGLIELRDHTDDPMWSGESVMPTESGTCFKCSHLEFSYLGEPLWDEKTSDSLLSVHLNTQVSNELTRQDVADFLGMGATGQTDNDRMLMKGVIKMML